MTPALALIVVVAGSRLPLIFALSAALTFAVVWLVGTYRSRCMAPKDELDALPPLDGDPLDQGWGKL